MTQGYPDRASLGKGPPSMTPFFSGPQMMNVDAVFPRFYNAHMKNNILKSRAAFLVVLLAVLPLAFAAAGGSGETPKPVLRADGFTEVASSDMAFAWKVDGTLLRAELRGKTTGWVAVGFHPSMMMKDANFIIGYVKNGSAVVEDQFGTGPVTHATDVSLGGSSDVKDVSGKEENGWTTLKFSIPLNSGDKYDGVIKAGAENDLIFAYGRADAKNTTSRHAKEYKLKVKI
jgi:hypothetical protein